MDKECEFCGVKAFEFHKYMPPRRHGGKVQDLCTFCYENGPTPRGVGIERAIWQAAGSVANYVERQLVRRLQNAVNHALQRVRENDL